MLTSVGAFSDFYIRGMTQDASTEYQRNAVLTATPEQLHLMLYDGAIRFTRQAREAMERKDLETSCEKLLRVQRIMLELENGLRPEVNPDLCRQMSSLYSFVYDRLVEANMKRDVALVDESLQVLEHMRETWCLLLGKLREAKAAPAATPPTRPASTAGVGEALSIEC